MNAPRQPDDRDDELLTAYHRASAHEGRAPGPSVRASILAQVRRKHAPAAANDGHWRGRAAAGVAVLGLVGWLTLHGLRTGPRTAAPILNTDMMAAAPVAQRTPAAEVRTEALVASNAAPVSAAPADSLQRAAAPRALAPRASAPGDATLVRRAVSAQFAGLFLPADSEHLNLIVVLMDRSGNIVRSAVESASASVAQRAPPAAPQDFQALGLRADEIAAPGYVRLTQKAATAGAPDQVLLVRYAWIREPGQ